MTVTLIGVDHDDLHGYDRLKHLLAYFEPDLIVSENDSATHKHTLRQRSYIHEATDTMTDALVEAAPTDLNENTVKSLLDTYGFEAAAIRDYSVANNVGVVYAGMPSTGMQVDVKEALEQRLYQRFFTAPNDELVTQPPSTFQQAIDDSYGDRAVPESVIKQLSLRERDDHYASELEPYVSSRHERVVGVFGHNHVYGSYEESLGERFPAAATRHLGDA